MKNVINYSFHIMVIWRKLKARHSRHFLGRFVPQHHEKRILSYSAAQMYDLVAEVERYPEFLPWCKAAKILSRREDGMVADLVVGTTLLREKFRSDVTFDRPRSIVVTYCSGPLSRLTNTWSFRPKGRKACEISFHVDFDFTSPLLRAAMTLFFDKALAKMVAAFEARAKALYG